MCKTFNAREFESWKSRIVFHFWGQFKAKIAAAASENEAIYCIRYAVVNRRLHLVWQTKSIVIKLNVCRLGLRNVRGPIMPTWTGNILQTYKLHVYREERVRIRNSEIDCRMWMYDNLTIGYQSIIIVRFERIVSGRFSPLTRPLAPAPPYFSSPAPAHPVFVPRSAPFSAPAPLTCSLDRINFLFHFLSPIILFHTLSISLTPVHLFLHDHCHRPLLLPLFTPDVNSPLHKSSYHRLLVPTHRLKWLFQINYITLNCFLYFVTLSYIG